MKVALLSHEGGGISSVAHGLAVGLAKKKTDVTVFTTTTSNVQSITEASSHYAVVNLPMFNLPPRSLWFHLRNSNALFRTLGDYDVVHAVSPEMAIPFASFRKLEKPLITTMHGSHRAALRAFVNSPYETWTLGDFVFNVLELPLHDSTTKLCFRGSDKLAVCSFTTLAELKTYEKVDVSKATVIYNGIDFEEIEKDSERSGKRETSIERPIMLYAGRLYWMKGISFVLKAFEKVRTKVKNVELRIFGKGPLENEVRKFIVSRGLQKDVTFGGSIPHKELIEEIRKSDLSIFPSIYESQPMFVLETMACRKPIITFDLPYAREIIKSDYNGILAETYNVEDLSCKIALILSEEELRFRIGENAYWYTKRNHNWDLQTEKYLKVYRKVTGR